MTLTDNRFAGGSDLEMSDAQRAAWAGVVDAGLRRRKLAIEEVLDAFPAVPARNDFAHEQQGQIIEQLLITLAKLGVDVDADVDDAALERIVKAAESSTAEVDALRQYMREATKHRILTREEEVEISRRLHFYGEQEEQLHSAARGLREKAERVRETRKLLMEDRESRQLPEVRSEIRRLERRVKRLESDAEDFDRSAEAAHDKAVAAKNEFITNNLRLVIKIAREHMPRPGVDFLDLIQAGNMGMMRAIDRFDETRGFKFSTFATHWVRQAISLYISDHKSNIRVPIHMNDQIRKLARVEIALRDSLGRKPTELEIAEELTIILKKEMTPEKVDKIRDARTIAAGSSLNDTLGDEDGSAEKGDIIPDPRAPDPEREMIAKVQREFLEDAVETLLTPRERRVIQLRFGMIDGQRRTLEEVGKRMDVTRERVRQIEAKALAKLRADRAISELGGRPAHARA